MPKGPQPYSNINAIACCALGDESLTYNDDTSICISAYVLYVEKEGNNMEEMSHSLWCQFCLGLSGINKVRAGQRTLWGLRTPVTWEVWHTWDSHACAKGFLVFGSWKRHPYSSCGTYHGSTNVESPVLHWDSQLSGRYHLDGSRNRPAKLWETTAQNYLGRSLPPE